MTSTMNTKTLYDVLSLPRVASAAHIKRRYRQLARKYHPDVAENKEAAHKTFIEITRAYETLSDPVKRQAYDLELRRQTEAIKARSVSAASAAYSARPKTADNEPGRTAHVRRNEPRAASDIINQAQKAFRQRKHGDAEALLRGALKDHPKNAKLHSLLGDVYRAERQTNAAIKSYSYAIQFDPLDAATEKKLNELIGSKIDDLKQSEVEAKPSRMGLLVANAICWSLAVFLLFLINGNPGVALRDAFGRGLPFGGGLSINVILLTAGAALAVGFGIGANGWFGSPSEELLFESGAGQWAVVPTGTMALIISVFSFPAAFASYCIIGLIQGSLSRAVLVVFLLVWAVTAIGAVAYNPQDFYDVLMFCGNLAFPAMTLGWALGSSMSPGIGEI